MYQEENQNSLLNDTLVGAGVAGTASAGVILNRARQLAKAQGISFNDALSMLKSDAVADISAAGQVISGHTPYDDAERDLRKNPGSEKRSPGSIRKYSRDATTKQNNPFFFAGSGTSDGYVRNPIAQAAIAARDAFAPSSEDFLGFKREHRLERGISPEGPKSDTVFSRIPLLDGIRDLLPERAGGFGAAERQTRADANIDLMKGNAAQSAGGFAGRAASDFINNGARSVWWLLNAPQAVVDVAAEGLTGMVNREGLYGLDYALEDEAKRRGWLGTDNSPANAAVNPVRFNSEDPSANDVQINRRVNKLRGAGQTGERLFSRRRVGNNLSTLLAAPGAVAINAGLGLNNITGGAEGRKAVFADEEDPTKTTNAVAEVAAKYFLGRQGDLLPYDEYSKVRPDVSLDDYRAYKAYRFNKNEDWNIFDDGDISIANGILRANDDGVDGAEIMFLGRSMPVNTVLMPTALGIGGSVLGASLARHGGLNLDGVTEGIERRRTELNRLQNQLGNTEFESNDPYIQEKQQRVKKLETEVDNKRRLRAGMARGPFSSFFKNKNIRGAGVINAGLAAGVAAVTGGALIGNELERRRREQKIAENEQRNTQY